MSFTIHELPRAKADKRTIFVWLLERSPQGAKSWLKFYDNLLVRLEKNADRFGQALENDDCHHLKVQQALFKTRRGRVYRVLYFIDGNDVYVLRVRGAGQAPVEPQDLGPENQ